MKQLILILSLCAFALTSCNSTRTDPGGTDRPMSQTNGVPTKAQRNPDIRLPYDISKAASVTQNSGNRNLPYIAITFDDGPTVHTRRLLDMLAERNIKATFYVIGRSAQRHPDIIRRMVAEGHEIGNHTWNHPNLTKLSSAQVRSELDRTADLIARTAGVRPRTMRPPYGALRRDQRVWIHQEYGYPTVLWDVDPRDWQRPGPGVVTNRILTNTRNGSIVLVHDLHKQSVDAMPRTLDGLLKRGFQFVTVSQLINQKDG